MNKNLIKRAERFARDAHNGQLRDGGKPYIVHPEQVANIISQVTDDPQMIAAAWLHDTIEDCDVTHEQLTDLFGLRVADLVGEVTHDDNKHFPNLKTREGAMLKFADRLSNLSSMESWNDKRQAKYLAKSKFWKTGEEI